MRWCLSPLYVAGGRDAVCELLKDGVSEPAGAAAEIDGAVPSLMEHLWLQPDLRAFHIILYVNLGQSI